MVQVNGKVRDRPPVAPDITVADLEALALASDKVRALLAGRAPGRVVVRAPAVVNIVPA